MNLSPLLQERNDFKMMKLLICGKGGCGKSTVAALLARAMRKRGKRIFLVDADESNIGLYRMLGLEIPESLMDVLGGKKGFREKIKASGTGFGGPPLLFPKDLRVDELPDACIASTDGIRMMSVGKIHHFGEGCACPMGNLFRLLFSSLRFEPQDLVIVDTAAGVEHFGRGLDGLCDHVLCVVDPSYESIMMAKRVKTFAAETNLAASVILNRLRPEAEKELEVALEGATIIGRLPDSRTIFLNNLKGTPLDPELPEIESVCDALETAVHDRRVVPRNMQRQMMEMEKGSA
jgi:CO dehydrogenase maturation factor